MELDDLLVKYADNLEEVGDLNGKHPTDLWEIRGICAGEYHTKPTKLRYHECHELR